jgi:hypothetical protein
MNITRDVTCLISYIDIQGNVEVIFSKMMNHMDINLINEDVLAISIEPVKSNLTWKILSFSGRYMKIKVDFEDKLSISSKHRDYLRIDIKDDLLLRASDKSYVELNSLSITKNIRT